MSFDPTQHLMKLKGKDYLPVTWRLVWLRQEHPDALIETEVVEHDPGNRVLVRARVTLPTGGSAMGWKSGKAAGFADYVEKAETGAIGRALGALGYGTSFTDDFDEGPGDVDGRAVVDSPVERAQRQASVQPQQQRPAIVRAAEDAAGRPAERIPPAPNHTGNGGGPILPATEAQVKAVYAAARQRLPDEDIEAVSRERFGVTPSALSRRQASEFIDWINKQG